MKRLALRDFDLKVRLGGVALVLAAAGLLALLPARVGGNVAQPTVVELCLALAAVCAGSVGAALLCVGSQMFEPVSSPRARAVRDDVNARPML